MVTVLTGQTLAGRKDFYQNNGTNGLYVRTNQKATHSWMEKLKIETPCRDDTQILDLIFNMTERQPDDRPTAQQVTNAILDFDGQQPYCGYCCYIDDGDTTTSYAGSVSSFVDDNDSSEQLSIWSETSTSSSSQTVQAVDSGADSVGEKLSDEDTIKLQTEDPMVVSGALQEPWPTSRNHEVSPTIAKSSDPADRKAEYTNDIRGGLLLSCARFVLKETLSPSYSC